MNDKVGIICKRCGCLCSGPLCWGCGYDHSTPCSAVSDGSTASYYELPKGATELQELISYRNMNAQMGEIFRACYRYGIVSHSPCLRDIRKIIFYAKAELARLEKLEEQKQNGTNS